MAFKQIYFLIWHSFLCLLPYSINASVNWGDCDRTRVIRRAEPYPHIDAVRRSLLEVVDMVEVAADRLEELLDFLQQDPLPSIYQQPKDLLISTFFTYAYYVDRRVLSANKKSYKQRADMFLTLKEVLGRSRTLQWNVGVARARTNRNADNTMRFPTINFQCSDNWLTKSGRLNRNGRPFYLDSRPVEEGGSTNYMTGFHLMNVREFLLPDDRKPFTDAVLPHQRKDLFNVNGVKDPFPSVISINPQLFATWKTLQTQKEQEPIADRLRRGEKRYKIMRMDNTFSPNQWQLEELMSYHASADLLVAVARATTLANYKYDLAPRRRQRPGQLTFPQTPYALASWQWPPPQGHKQFALRTADEQCGQEGDTHAPSGWQCVLDFARDPSKAPANNSNTYKFLVVALYLDNYDWSSGFNQPLESLRQRSSTSEQGTPSETDSDPSG